MSCPSREAMAAAQRIIEMLDDALGRNTQEGEGVIQAVMAEIIDEEMFGADDDRYGD